MDIHFQCTSDFSNFSGNIYRYYILNKTSSLCLLNQTHEHCKQPLKYIFILKHLYVHGTGRKKVSQMQCLFFTPLALTTTIRN